MSISGAAANMVQIPRYILEDSPLLGKKLQDFEDAETRAKEAIALVGQAEEIGHLRSQAVVERDAADAASAENRVQCKKLLEDAQSEANEILTTARLERKSMVSNTESRTELAQRMEENALLRLREAQQAEILNNTTQQELDRKAEALDVREVNLEELEQLLLNEKSMLATVREQINSALG